MRQLNDFIAYLEEQAANHSIYVWGGQGQDHTTISEAWIRERETSTDNANRAIAFWKKQVKGYGMLSGQLGYNAVSGQRGSADGRDFMYGLRKSVQFAS